TLETFGNAGIEVGVLRDGENDAQRCRQIRVRVLVLIIRDGSTAYDRPDGHAEQASCGNLRKAQIDDAPREHEVDVFLLIRVPSSETQRHSLGDGIGRIEIERSAARVYLSDCGRGGTCKRRPERREGTAKRGQ